MIGSFAPEHQPEEPGDRLHLLVAARRELGAPVARDRPTPAAPGAPSRRAPRHRRPPGARPGMRAGSRVQPSEGLLPRRTRRGTSEGVMRPALRRSGGAAPSSEASERVADRAPHREAVAVGAEGPRGRARARAGGRRPMEGRAGAEPGAALGLLRLPEALEVLADRLDADPQAGYRPERGGTSRRILQRGPCAAAVHLTRLEAGSSRGVAASTRGRTAAEEGTRGPSLCRWLPCWR